MALKCNKFLPNIFNKTKCQHCFAAKEAHSAAALENNKASRKVTKCGYLFVSPGYDFSNPLDRTRRWQRRLFRLYDDGELTYSVDENPDTVPQGMVDMNKCTDVIDAEPVTTHPNSLSIITPDKIVYIKSTTREEIHWWQETLAEFPKALKAIKPRRKQPFLILSNKENQDDISDVESSKSYSTFRGVRSMKHRSDSSHQEGLRKSNSLHDLSTTGRSDLDDSAVSIKDSNPAKVRESNLSGSRFLSRSGDRLDMLGRDKSFSLSSEVSSPRREQRPSLPVLPHPPTFTMPRSTWTRTGQPVPSAFLTPTLKLKSSQSVTSSNASSSSSVASTSPRRSSVDEPSRGVSAASADSRRSHRERSASLKDFPKLSVVAPLAQGESVGSSRDNLTAASVSDRGSVCSMSADETDSNETDELKMARSSELHVPGAPRPFSQAPLAVSSSSSKYEDLYMKKGWLIKQYGTTEKESKKHWFVLGGNSLRYYQDAKSEESNMLDGRIDLSTCFEVSELPTHRNYGFKIKTSNGEYILAAMTMGIRNNWMKAIRLCMELHNTDARSKQQLAFSTKNVVRASLDDLEFKSGAAASSTAAVTGAGGETAFQLVTSRDSYRRESQRPARRHHSDVNPDNVSSVLSVKEFSVDIDSLDDADSTDAATSGRRRSPSDSLAWAGERSETDSRSSRRNITSEGSREEMKRDMRRAKSPSARVRDRTRAAKTPRLASAVKAEKTFSRYHSQLAASSGAFDASSTISDDIPLSEEDFSNQEDMDEAGSATASDVVGGGEEALVEILETEVESLKDQLEQTQTELDQVHKDNVSLKSRLHKESSQSVDSGYSPSSRWGLQLDSGRYSQTASSTAELQSLKRQLKESRDTVQRQKMDIDGLRSRLDMSVSKLTGTEKALSEALKDYKQEKDKFMKLSSEWNRRIRTMEGQHKDTVHKLELSRETLQAKERESRRLEAEVKANLQKTREQEREILKLKAVEQEYKQLKEKFDDYGHEVSNLRAQLKERDQWSNKLKEDHERKMEAMEHDYQLEREHLETHVEQLKGELYHAHDRQASLSDNMTANMADMLREKDDIISQLEEKLIEADKKMVDLSEEVHAEMGENAELNHSLDTLRQEKQTLASNIGQLEGQLSTVRSKLQTVESDNFSLNRQLEELRCENTQLHDGLVKAGEESSVAPSSGVASHSEEGRLQRIVVDLNQQIRELQSQLEYSGKASSERSTSFVSATSSIGPIGDESLCSSAGDHQQDLLHSMLLVDSELKDVNCMLLTLRQGFDAYLATLGDERDQGNKLADQIEDIGHRCQRIQEMLLDPPEEDETTKEYKHIISVGPSSSGAAIMKEYVALKLKFDQAVAELRKARKDTKDVNTVNESLRSEEKKVREMLDVVERGLKMQLVELTARVDTLTGVTSPAISDSSVRDINCQVKDLEDRISAIELHADAPQLSSVKNDIAEVTGKLSAIATRLSSEELEGQVSLCKDRLSRMSASKVECSQSEQDAASSGVSGCLHEIREQVREIGELFDSLEEEDEDSDSEDEGEQTTMEDLRDKLSHLTEYIETHSKLSTSDWSLLRLLSLQREALTQGQSEAIVEADSDTDEHKLQMYADRVSLEAVLVYEMANILQTKNCLMPEDSVYREIDNLNSVIINLHHKLDTEMKTMHFEEPQADVLSSYTQYMAEKILINGQIFADTFDQRSHLGKAVVEASSSVQPVVLATEALVRSQIDSFILSNMDNTVTAIMSLPTHLASRSIIQGELTHALTQLKRECSRNPQVLQPGPANYKFTFEKLLERQKKVFSSIENYVQQISHSLAVIIFKESEEMTIVEGPESVLEAMCSDLSTIIETHIQHYKEKCRSAVDTHSAHKYDLTVNELRQCREVTLQSIKAQHEEYAKDPSSVRDSSLDIPVQSLDNTINSFGEILSLKSIVAANTNFLRELLQMGDTILCDLDLDVEAPPEGALSIEKGVTAFVNSLSEALQTEALSKAELARNITAAGSKQKVNEEDTLTVDDLRVPDLCVTPGGNMSAQGQALVREAVFGAQLSVSLFKQKLLMEREMHRLKAQRPVRVNRERRRLNTTDTEDEGGHETDDTLDLQHDFQALLAPLEEVLENKREDEAEVLHVLLGVVSQIIASARSCDKSGVEEQLRQLEQKLHHEMDVLYQRHATHLEVFKQESSRLAQTLEDEAAERDHYEDRVAQLEEDLATMQGQHEEEKERVKQDILTAVHAIRSNEEKSETNAAQKASKLGQELAVQKLTFRKILGSIKTDLATKDKTSLVQTIEDHIKGIPLNSEEEEEEEYQPPLPSQPPPTVPDTASQITLEEHFVGEADQGLRNMSHHEHEVEQLKKEKDEALAEEMRNTKAALDAVRSAYEDELTKERSKYKEALLTMYTEEYINEIRMRHQEEEDRMSEELQKVNMHYSSKCEDYKLLEMKLQQTKHDFESHINQLIASNDHLEGMLNTEIESLKEFIKTKPSITSLTTGSATMEEELYDSKIMVRVKDAELQKLRSQVKNLENSLHRTTEEQRQTMTQYMQTLKKSSEMKNQYQEEVTQLTEKLSKVLGSQGLKANIRRTPSFHQRARSPSPQGAVSPRKEADHSSRDSHRRRHMQSKDLRRSKSSPSLPYVFDGKVSPMKLATAKPGRRSRSPKT